jgi:preprotein translocase subunit SecD
MPRPRRTLLLFLAFTLALAGLLLGIDLNQSKKDTSNVWEPNLGLDLKGGTRITLQAKNENGKRPDPVKLEQARSIIDQRVNATGVSEAEVTTQGGDQIIIEIPGQSKQGIADQVGRTAQLRFRLLWASTVSARKPISAAEQEKLQKQVAKADWSDLSLDQLIKAETEGSQTLPTKYGPAMSALAEQAKGFACSRKSLPKNDRADLPLITCEPSTGEVMILSPMIIPGTDVKSATPTVPSNTVSWVVAIDIKGKGRKTFDKVTEALFAQQTAGQDARSRFAIVLDGEVLSAPTTNGHFVDGKSQISGNFTAVSARALANQLKYGALPLTFELNGSSYEGPTLAGTQLHAGLVAGGIGMALVVLYMLFYYRGLAFVAVSSLILAALLTYLFVLLLGEGLGFTLTLPGIAGLIVAIGITADSFIVFFERLRDEVRDGKSLRLAVESGWERARNTILAADAVSILAALILYIFAIGVVRGFAFALGLTTLIDILVVFCFTKPLMSLLARTTFFGEGHKLSGLDAEHLGISGRKVSEIGRGISNTKSEG